MTLNGKLEYEIVDDFARNGEERKASNGSNGIEQNGIGGYASISHTTKAKPDDTNFEKISSISNYSSYNIKQDAATPGLPAYTGIGYPVG